MAGLTTASETPSVCYAGDTILFSISDGTYSAADWTLTYDFRADNGKAISWTATADGTTGHLVSLAPAATADYIPGVYSGVARMSNATQKVTVWKGEIEIRTELAVQSDNFDTRSWAKRCLDDVEALMEKRASRDVIASTVAGQAIERARDKDLEDKRKYYRAIYERELAELAVAQGKATGRNIVYKFCAPTN